MKFLKSAGLLAFLILSGRSTQAALIQYEFSGEVYAVAEMGGLVEVGAPYTATWVFNANALDSIPATYRGEYEAVAASLVVSGITVNKQGGSLEVRNESSHDGLFFNTPNPGIRFTASFDDPTGALLSSDALPLQIPDFPDRYLEVFWEPPPYKFSASIDSITVSIIPEPSALSLLLFGLAGAWRRERAIM